MSTEPGGSGLPNNSAVDRPSLSDDEKKQLRLEEIFRAEVRDELQSATRDGSKLLKALNSPLCIFLLSTVIVGIISWQYKEYHDKAEKRIATASDTRKILYEMEYRASLLQQELSSPSSWPRSLVKKNFYSLHNDPIFDKCSETCLGNRLLAQSWSVDSATAAAMRTARAKAEELEQVILSVIPDQDERPLAESEVAQLRPASNALSDAVAQCIRTVDGTYLALSAAPSPGKATTGAAAPDNVPGKGLSDTENGVHGVAGSTEGSGTYTSNANDVLGRWKSITNVWTVIIEARDGRFVMLDLANASGVLPSPLVSGEFRPLGNHEFSGRHVWRTAGASSWGTDDGMKVVQISKDRIYVQYADSKYTAGWNFIRDNSTDPPTKEP
jgi:hypothetical protein